MRRVSQSQFIRFLALILLLAAIYFISAKLGLSLARVHASATAVWPPAGIALAALLLLGYRVWPGIFLGAFLANITTAGSVLTSFGIATGNTLEGLLGAYLVNRFCSGLNAFEQAQNVFKFTLFAAMLSTTVSATFGVTSLGLGGYADWSDYGAIWLTWWLGDAAGDLVIAPLLILWSENPRIQWNRKKMLEAALLLLFVFVAGHVIFGSSPRVYNRLPFAYMPILVWAAFRFGQRETATASFLMAGIAIWGVLQGVGPFVMETDNESLLLLGAFVCTVTVTAMALAAGISERRRIEQRFQVTVESAPSAMIMVNHEGRIILANKQTEQLFGYTRGELLGQSIDILVPRRYRERHSEHRGAFSRQPAVRPMGAGRDFYGVRKDGSEVPVEIGLNPVQTEEGLSVLASVVDITERKQADEQLRRHAADLESFSYSLAHDLRSPVLSISGLSRLTIKDYAERLGPTGQDYLRRIAGHAGQMDELIRDLLTYSRLSGSILKPQWISLKAVLTDLLKQLAEEIRRSGAQIDIQEPLPELLADRTVVAQILSNLLSNAMKFVGPGAAPQVRVWAEDNGQFFRLWVEDHGIGIAPEHQEKIFQTFERLHNPESYPGTGIGLAIVAKGVERLGGRKGVESELGRGSRFWIELPRRPSASGPLPGNSARG